ncbi:MAG: hypothetical protein LLG04_16545 [Parachlamydia sp.]|nr:hypothetical protein [Parachlamydia sp.]
MFQATAIQKNQNAQLNWADFQLPKVSFLQVEKVQKIAGGSLAGLAVLAAIGTAAAIAFTVTPLAIAGLAVLSIALTAAGIYLLCKSPSKNDPEFCKRRARKAGADIEAQQMGYEQIRQKYGHLIDLKRINLDALRTILHRDAEALAFKEFKGKHGSSFAYELLTQESRNLLKVKYLDHVRQNADSMGGVVALAQSQEARLFGATEKELAAFVMESEKRRFLSQDTGYQAFRNRNGFDFLASACTGDASFQQQLEKSFLNLPYEEARVSQYAQDRKLFGIEGMELLNRFSAQVNQRAEGMRYLEFKSRFGTEFLTHNLLSKLNFEKFHREVQEHLVAAGSLNEMQKMQPEMQAFGLSRDMILKQRWTRMTIREIVAKEAETFLNEAGRLFKREEISGKVLAETHQVIELLQLCPGLFDRGFVLAQDALPGQLSVARRLETEIAGLARLENLSPADLALMHRHGLIEKENPHLRVKGLQYVAAHARDLLLGSGQALAYWEQVSMPHKVIEAFRVGKARVLTEQEQHRRCLEAIKQELTQARGEAEKQRDQEISLIRSGANLSGLQRECDALRFEVESAERVAAQNERRFNDLKSDLQRAQAEFERHTQRTAILPAEIAALTLKAKDKDQLAANLLQAKRQMEEIKRQVDLELQAFRVAQSALIQSSLVKRQAEMQFLQSLRQKYVLQTLEIRVDQLEAECKKAREAQSLLARSTAELHQLQATDAQTKMKVQTALHAAAHAETEMNVARDTLRMTQVRHADTARILQTQKQSVEQREKEIRTVFDKVEERTGGLRQKVMDKEIARHEQAVATLTAEFLASL